MPVRSRSTGKVRTAAQRAAAKRNLEKARATKSRASKFRTLTIDGAPISVPKLLHRPTGKNTLLVHHSGQAGKILREGFKGKPEFFFTNASEAHNYSGFGSPVSVLVPRKKVRKDMHPQHTDQGTYSEHSLFGAVRVRAKDLQGIKIRNGLR